MAALVVARVKGGGGGTWTRFATTGEDSGGRNINSRQ